jgi:ribonuclease BN (tRNA processing enzyme)
MSIWLIILTYHTRNSVNPTERVGYDEAMKLTVLGSGCSIPSPNRSASAYLLETSGGNILLDCSPSSLQRMAAEHLDWAGLDAIWISHFHLDHVGGLPALLSSLRHAPQTENRIKPLTIYGPPGLGELLAAWDASGNYRLFEQRFGVEVMEVVTLEPFLIVPGVEAVAFKSPHTAESHAIHFRDAEATLVFTSDTGMDPAIAAIANGVDLLLMECSFVRDKPVGMHLELAEAMHIVRKARPKRVMLTHLYPQWDDVDFQTEVTAFQPFCEVIKAEDGLRMSIPQL